MALLKSKAKQESDKDQSKDMPKRSLGVAYDMQRRNSKRKKMAEGGDVKEPLKKDRGAVEGISYEKVPDGGYGAIIFKAEGGQVKTNKMKRPSMTESSIVKSKLRDEDDDMINDKISMKAAEQDMQEEPQGLESDNDQMKPSEDEIMADHFAKGGMVDSEEELEHAASIAGAIMARRKRMAEGGMVDLDENSMEEPNQMDSLNEAALKENYDEDMEDVSQPMDSNEMGDDIDSDKHDMVSAIRRKMKMRSPISR